MSVSGGNRTASNNNITLQVPQFVRRQKSGLRSAVSSARKKKSITADEIDLEFFGQLPTTETSGKTAAQSNTKGATEKAALQKLASSFVALNKRKAEKRERDQAVWRNLIQSALDLQKGKIPLLLAVEAGNQSMCRELLSAQTAEQLKVSIHIFLILSFLVLYFPRRI